MKTTGDGRTLAEAIEELESRIAFAEAGELYPEAQDSRGCADEAPVGVDGETKAAAVCVMAAGMKGAR